MNRSQAILLALVVVFAYLSLLLVLPFVQYVLAAVLLSYVLYPLQGRLESRTSPAIAAASLVVLAIVAVVIPFVVVVAIIVDELTELVEGFEPETLQLVELEAVLEAELGIEVDVAERVTEGAQNAGLTVAERSIEWAGTLTHVVIGIGLTLFLVYYLLKDGDAVIGWLRDVTPLPATVQDELYVEFDRVTRAVLLGHVLVAIIQGFIAGLGLVATGVPNAVFWTVVMIVLALIPLVGAFVVWGPAVGYLVLTGEPVLGLALFVYSAVVVGISDDYLRPIIVDRYADISPAVIIVGVLGGIYAFGITGLFFGPIVLGALIATVEVVDEYYEQFGAGTV